MGARGITAKESVPASRKLGAEDARSLAAAASTVIVAKGKQVQTFKPGGKPSAEVVEAMLGPTGNLRAPTIRKGRTLLVGFDASTFQEKMLD